MQQTENYKLNLIEASDPFSPEALNENARKLEAALTAKADRTALAAEQSAREAVAATVPRLSFGTYVGNGTKNRSIALPFTPKAVYVVNSEGQAFIGGPNSATYYGGLTIEGYPLAYNGNTFLKIVSGGFQVSYISTGCTTNTSERTYHYIAIG